MLLKSLRNIYLKICSCLALILTTVFASQGQNLIGYSAMDINKYMSAGNSNMIMNKVNNKSFSYLKYSDKFDTQTMFFFLTTDSICKNIRIVCNKNIRNSKLMELDSTYLRTGKNMWTDSHSGKKYRIELVDEEWSFSIIIEPEN